MKKMLLAAAFLLTASLGFAQSSPPSDALYKALGEKPGLVKLMDDFMPRLLADARTGPFFKPVDQKRVKEQLVVQFCQLSGGPCDYEGADMKTAHMNMRITEGDFNALVEALQVAMTAQGIAFSTQNQLLARLAPMHRAIISKDQ